ncbi:hypothetical protein ABIA39_004375 [Nocardia sp. GAS34]
MRPCLLVPPPFARRPVVVSHNDFSRPWATRVGLPRLRKLAAPPRDGMTRWSRCESQPPPNRLGQNRIRTGRFGGRCSVSECRVSKVVAGSQLTGLAVSGLSHAVAGVAPSRVDGISSHIAHHYNRRGLRPTDSLVDGWFRRPRIACAETCRPFDQLDKRQFWIFHMMGRARFPTAGQFPKQGRLGASSYRQGLLGRCGIPGSGVPRRRSCPARRSRPSGF